MAFLVYHFEFIKGSQPPGDVDGAPPVEAALLSPPVLLFDSGSVLIEGEVVLSLFPVSVGFVEFWFPAFVDMSFIPWVIIQW